MAIEPTPSPPPQPTPETLLRLQTQINVVKAQHTDLLTQVRQRRLVEADAAEAGPSRAPDASATNCSPRPPDTPR